MTRTRSTAMAAAAFGALLLAGCGGGEGGGGELTGQVRSDGSSTVFPVAEAFAEEFQIQNRGVRVTVGVSGTGGGFQRFCSGETALSNASREMSEGERERCEANGVDFVRLPVALDGISVITNPANEFVRCLTVEELRRVWEPNSSVRTWRDVRSEFPAEEIQLYGPGTDSGTFDYFTEAIVGEAGASRSDYQASEDDNVLVQGVSGDRYSLGYLGYAYYEQNRDRLKLLGVDDGSGCAQPTPETIGSGEYAPLSRPLFIYVKTDALDRPAVASYVRFMLNNAAELVPPTGYIPLAADRYRESLQEVEAAVPGPGADAARESA